MQQQQSAQPPPATPPATAAASPLLAQPNSSPSAHCWCHRRWAQPRLALLRLSEDLRSVERSALLECAGVEGTQKNYMPLVLNTIDGGGGDDELYLAVQAQPLVVGRVDPASLACAVVQQEERVDPALGRVSAGSRVGGPV